MPHASISLCIGQYSDDSYSGFNHIDFNLETMALTSQHNVSDIENPSYLARTDGGWYAISELSEQDGAALYFLNDKFETISTQPLKGDHPCHVAISDCHTHLGVAHYGSGSFEVYTLAPSGEIHQRQALVQNEGKGHHSVRQLASHGHQIVFVPQSNQVMTVDLGLDTLNFYRLNAVHFAQQQSLQLPAGCGPRHAVFRRDGQIGYILCELDETLRTIERQNNGKWQQIRSQPAFPKHSKGEAASAIKLSSDQRYVYLSGRHQSIISWFDITTPNSPCYQGFVKTEGRFPRDITLSKDGHWLVVANQHSDNLVLFTLDKKTGQPTLAKIMLTLPKPVCVVFD
ncbi:lactonase family protein [Vibrio methylphosphonaticus]|uniref:lactonase family protein n=1 Tax=Vibrio methylphosphonaticus TaxID=2946866 RepID=UPI002029D2EF|nr:lactonase family protein [Vibrio methylphosphonaticus]MCL9776172.1 lactonase family protein [Vibrio methylphosphonaticus]